MVYLKERKEELYADLDQTLNYVFFNFSVHMLNARVCSPQNSKLYKSSNGAFPKHVMSNKQGGNARPHLWIELWITNEWDPYRSNF